MHWPESTALLLSVAVPQSSTATVVRRTKVVSTVLFVNQRLMLAAYTSFSWPS